MGWTFSTERPVYVQLVQRIRADILSGHYPAGSPFPSVRQIALAAAVNPNTMQRALGELEREGLLISRGTAGRVVTDDEAVLRAARQRAAQEALERLVAEARALGVSRAEILRFLEEKEEWT